MNILLITVLINLKIDFDPRNDSTEKRSSRNKITNQYAVASSSSSNKEASFFFFHINFIYVERVLTVYPTTISEEKNRNKKMRKKRNYTEFVCRNVCVKLKAK